MRKSVPPQEYRTGSSKADHVESTQNQSLVSSHSLPSPIPSHPFLSLLDGNRLGQVPREIDVQALTHGKPISHQLQRDHVDETLEAIDRARDLNPLCLVGRELGLTDVADDNGLALASDDLLVRVEGLGEDVVAGQDHDDWQVLIDEGENTMLEFAGHDGFAVEVGDFLDLEGAWNFN